MSGLDFFGVSHSGLALLNDRSEFLYANSTFLGEMGCREIDQIRGMPLDTILKVPPSGETSPVSGGIWQGTTPARRKDGSEEEGDYLLLSLGDCYLLKMCGEPGKSKGEETMGNHSGLLEDFYYALSHDLKLPLTQIGLSIDLLQERCDCLSEENRYLLAVIERSCAEMSSHLESLKKLFGISRSKLMKCLVDISALARETVQDIRRAYPEREVETGIEERLEACADPELLKIVLRNLFENAFKFTRDTPGARMEFGRKTFCGEVVFYVMDNGPGFEMSQAERIFRPFERLHRCEQVPGTGMGLPLVKRIVEQHGGRICALGKKGKGAVFLFTLPSS